MKNVLWTGLHLVAMLLMAFVLGVVLHLAMFWFGPWADPPGFELSVGLFALMGVPWVAWRTVRRERVPG